MSIYESTCVLVFVQVCHDPAYRCVDWLFVQAWDNPISEKFYTAFLDVVLLVLPLVVMSTAYGMISYKLWPRGAARRPTTTTLTNGKQSVSSSSHWSVTIVRILYYHYIPGCLVMNHALVSISLRIIRLCPLQCYNSQHMAVSASA